MSTYKTWKPGLVAVYPHFSHGTKSATTHKISTILLKKDVSGNFTWLADDSAGAEGYSTRGWLVGNDSIDPLWVGTPSEWDSLLAQSPMPTDLLANIERKPNEWAPGLVAVYLPESDNLSLMMRTEDNYHSWIAYKGEWQTANKTNRWHGQTWKPVPEWVGTRVEYDLLKAISPDPATLAAHLARLKAKAPKEEEKPEVDHSSAILDFLEECGISAFDLDQAREILGRTSDTISRLWQAEAKLDQISGVICG